MEETPVAGIGQIAHEPGLPHPWVAYGKVFHVFADNPDGPWRLCDCAQPAIATLADLFDLNAAGPQSWTSAVAQSFGRAVGIPEQSPMPDPWNHLDDNRSIWAQAACHRCGTVTPSLRWHDQGSQFAQFHGWYVQQARLRAGFPLDDSMLFADADAAVHTENAASELVELRRKAHPRLYCPETQWLLELYKMINRPIPIENAHEESGIHSRIWQAVIDPEAELDAKDLEAISDADRQVVAEWKKELTPDPAARRKWRRLFEDEARAEFGYRKIGDGFVAEPQLAALVTEIVGASVTVERHHRPNWLEKLELDIWIPELQVGIEYQGQQHYKPVAHWGGEEALARQQRRDRRKRRLCAKQGVTLIEISYTEPLTRIHIEERLGLAAIAAV